MGARRGLFEDLQFFPDLFLTGFDLQGLFPGGSGFFFFSDLIEALGQEIQDLEIRPEMGQVLFKIINGFGEIALMKMRTSQKIIHLGLLVGLGQEPGQQLFDLGIFLGPEMGLRQTQGEVEGVRPFPVGLLQELLGLLDAVHAQELRSQDMGILGVVGRWVPFRNAPGRGQARLGTEDEVLFRRAEVHVVRVPERDGDGKQPGLMRAQVQFFAIRLRSRIIPQGFGEGQDLAVLPEKREFQLSGLGQDRRRPQDGEGDEQPVAFLNVRLATG